MFVEELDYVIVGAGPAGLQAAYFLERDGRDYVVLEAERPGSFFERFPRHRMLISHNKVNTGFSDPEKNLRWDWNSLLSDDLQLLFADYSRDYFPRADDLVRYLQSFAAKFALRVQENTKVVRLERAADGRFEVHAADGRQWLAKRVVVATGHTVTHSPDVPGVELCEQYREISTDPEDYLGQRVMIVGKGNSGLETAENIYQHTASVHLLSPTPVRLAWTTHHVSDLRVVYNNVLDSYQLKMQNTVLDARLEKVEREPDGRLRVFYQYTHGMGQRWELVVDRVLLCCGFRFDHGIFGDSLAVDTCHDGRWPAVSSTWESTSEPGLYFVGTLMQARDYKKSFSGFIHGFRYNLKFLNSVFAERYHGETRECSTRLAVRPDDLVGHLIHRCNETSSLFQVPAFIGDVYDLETGEVWHDTPVDYALDAPGLRDRTKLLVTLEYGKLPKGTDPFNIPRDPHDGSTSQFVHPVLRLYRGTELVDTHHVPEDLENEWDIELYTVPCKAAVARMLDSLTAPAPARV